MADIVMPRKNLSPPRRARGATRTADNNHRIAPEERRSQILRVSAELFAERGYTATTVRNIAEQAGLLSGSLYHHFDSKEAILDEILTGYVAGLLEQVKAVEAEDVDVLTAVNSLIHLTVLALDEHRDAILLLQNEWGLIRDIPRFRHLVKSGDEIAKVWTRLLERGMKEKVFRNDVPPGLIYRFARDALWVAARWYEPGHTYSLEQIADDYCKVVFEGITTRR
jgi:AcrR family transcriptional regulator